jgi:hypothetical protein
MDGHVLRYRRVTCLDTVLEDYVLRYWKVAFLANGLEGRAFLDTRVTCIDTRASQVLEVHMLRYGTRSSLSRAWVREGHMLKY